VGDALLETLDEAMHHVYTEYGEISDWRFCPEQARGSAGS
jgi:hypothetical protein